MSDRACTRLIIKSIPEDQVKVATAVLTGFFDVFDVSSAAELVAGEYVDEEGRLDLSNEIAQALIAAAPGMAFTTWTDPKYEYEGVLSMYTPELGLYQHGCNADGDATFTAWEIERWLGLTMVDLTVKLGKPWTDALFSARVEEVHS